MPDNIKEKKLNILIATGIYPPDIGGPATYVKILQKELPKFGFDVKVITYSSETKEDSEVCRISRKQNILKRYWDYFFCAYNLIPWSDIVFVQGPVSEGLPVWLACKLRRKKYILKIVGDYAWEQGRQRFGVKDLLDDFQAKKYSWRIELMRYLQKIVAKNAAVIIVPSNYLKGIIKNWGIKENKIKVVYNAAREVVVKEEKEKLGNKLNFSGNIICSVGRLVPWKGFDALIDVVSDLIQINPDFKLYIYGDGPDKDSLDDKIKKLDLGKNIKLMGSVDQCELHKHIKASDCFVLNTGYEGLPHIVIEVMAIGVPVITTKVGGNTEVVKNGVNGMLVEYNNRKELKKEIMNLFKDEDKRNKIVVDGISTAKKFSQERMINNLVRILSEII